MTSEKQNHAGFNPRDWHNALYTGDMAIIEAGIKGGLSQAQLNYALGESAYRGKALAVKAFLEAGASPLFQNDQLQFKNALHYALAAPSSKCVKMLAPLSDLRQRLEGGATALMMAAKSKSSASLELLLELAPEMAKEKDNKGWSAFFYASYYDSLSCFAKLLPLSDPEARDSEGKTALMVAAERNSMGTLQALLPLCDPAAKDHEGRDAVAVAKAAGSLKSARFLTAYLRVRGERAALEGAAAPALAARSSRPL